MKNLRVFLFLAIVMLFGQACKKKNMELGSYMGTAICASENFDYVVGFKVNGVTNPANVDFRNNPYYVTLTADLTEAVSWTIKITGTVSGATKTYTGTSKTVNVKWYGTADGGEPNGDKFFTNTGEAVTITFTPACSDKITTIPLTLTHGAIFNSFGTLMVDFDNIIAVYKYNSVDPNIGPWVRNIDTLLTNTSPQGGKCHKMYGPAGHTGWYIGGFGQAVDLTTILGTNLKSDSVYVNIYMLGSLTGNNNTTVSLDMVETVGGNDYHFKKNVVINWAGWKMVSYKLSDLYIGDPTKVKSLDFSVGPNTYNGETECYIDFVIFTKGKPFLGAN